MALNLADRVTFITGAGSGIGKATALRFAAAGSRLFLVGRTESKLVETQQEINTLYPNVEVAYITADMTNKQEMDASVKAVIDRFGEISIVFLNAGILSKMSDEFSLWEETITTNLTSVMYLSKTVLPYLEESVKKHGHASLIVNSSIYGFLKLGSIAPYVASKHGATGWTLSLFETVRNKGIKVTAVNPGATDTPMSRANYAKQYTVPVESIAHTVYFVASFPEGGCPTEVSVFPQYSAE